MISRTPLAREWNLLMIAVMFLTRLRVPFPVEHSYVNLNASAKYFPLVGWLVGAVAALSFWAADAVLPQSVAVFVSMGIGLLMTGAFHEDGFADACDGLGGGWSREQVLEIMKDSRLGTYGACGLFFALGGKWLLLSELPTPWVPLLLWAGHAFSRWMAVTFLWTDDYVREEGKSKPLAERIATPELLLATLFGWLPLLVLASGPLALGGLILLGVRCCWGCYLRKRIGGFTGDCLGATQQITEVGFYLWALLVLT